MESDKTMLISVEKFEALCRNSQKLDTICDYIMDRANAGKDYIGLDVIATMAGISNEVNAALNHKEEAADDE